MEKIIKYLKDKKFDIVYYRNILRDFTVDTFIVLFKNEKFFSLYIDLLEFEMDTVNLNHWLNNLDGEQLNKISDQDSSFKTKIRDFRLNKILKKDK
jgi:hypothetical protein